MSERQSKVETAVLQILRKRAPSIPMYGDEGKVSLAKEIAAKVEEIVQEEQPQQGE